MHSPTEPHVIQLGSILLFLYQCVIFSWTASTSSFHAYFPHTSSITIHAVTDCNMAHWTKQNLNPSEQGCTQSVNRNPPAPAHKDIYPLTRQEVMTTVCKFGKFNSIQFFFLFDSPCKEYFLSFECVYVSEIAWHLLSVPYIQNNLHKRTIVILIGLDRCRGEGGGKVSKGKGRGEGKAPWSTMFWSAR